MRLKNYICLYFLLLISASVFSQDKSTVAVKTEHPPKIDGDLSDEVWDNAPALTGFIQNYPDMGKPASQPTEVKVLYDDNAIYVGAYIFDDPALIRKQFTARDAEQQTDVDYFSVFFDTYNDNQNGF